MYKYPVFILLKEMPKCHGVLVSATNPNFRYLYIFTQVILNILRQKHSCFWRSKKISLPVLNTISLF